MFHKVTVIGNLGGDPELKYMPNGDAVTSFSVATNRKWKNSDGTPGEETVWFRVTAWRKLAETCNTYLKKGKQVYIEGRLTPDKTTGGPRVWQANDGASKASYELQALEVKFLGTGGGTGPLSDSGSESGFSNHSSAIQQQEEEIPF